MKKALLLAAAMALSLLAITLWNRPPTLVDKLMLPTSARIQNVFEEDGEVFIWQRAHVKLTCPVRDYQSWLAKIGAHKCEDESVKDRPLPVNSWPQTQKWWISHPPIPGETYCAYVNKVNLTAYREQETVYIFAE